MTWPLRTSLPSFQMLCSSPNGEAMVCCKENLRKHRKCILMDTITVCLGWVPQVRGFSSGIFETLSWIPSRPPKQASFKFINYSSKSINYWMVLIFRLCLGCRTVNMEEFPYDAEYWKLNQPARLLFCRCIPHSCSPLNPSLPGIMVWARLWLNPHAESGTDRCEQMWLGEVNGHLLH